MAILYVLPFSLLILLFSATTHSLKCTSQTFANNKLYKNCTDLPSLDSYLHYTYDPDNSSLSVAFIAPPPKSNGWIGWGINPNATGMVGAQVLIAYKKSNGNMTIKTYNLVSYRSIVPSKLSFDVSDTSAEYSDGVMRIFANLALPAKMTALNQVWQVGPSVDGDMLAKHDFQPANLKAKGELKLAEVQSNSNTSASNSTGSPTTGGDSAGNKSNSSRIGETRFGLYLILVFIFGILLL